MKLDGIDFQASYDWDWGDLGAFNVGIIGTYYLHQQAADRLGAPIEDQFTHDDQPGPVNEAQGVPNSCRRLRYRARLGWANGPWSAHRASWITRRTTSTPRAPPPNVNGNFCAVERRSRCGRRRRHVPCAIQDYTNVLPSYYTFDLSLGYNTMDAPANEYLRNIGVQLVVQNILDKHGPYQYRISTGGGNPCTCDLLGVMPGVRFH